MALDPETMETAKNIGWFFGAILSSVGITLGGSKALEKRKTASAPEQTPPAAPTFCQEHHKCFEEIKEIIGDVKADVAYIRGAIDKR